MKLFDLSGEEDDRKISPYCWRIRLALAYKDLYFASVPWRAEEKDAIAFSGQGQVFTQTCSYLASPGLCKRTERMPASGTVLVDGDTTVVDSWRITEYLESSYPNAPSFFGSKEGKQKCAAGLLVREQQCGPHILVQQLFDHLYHLKWLFSCHVGKGGVKFIVYWLDHAIYPVLMQILCADALEVAHEMDKAFFRNKWEYAHGMALEQV